MRLALILWLAIACSAATVDRLAVTVGRTAITELQIDEDLRVAALLNRKEVLHDLESRRAAADRLIEQLLIRNEIQMSRYPVPSPEDVEAYYAKVVETLGGSERASEALARYRVSEQVLREHLTAQLATLRFIAFRFRPDVSISDAEIENAFRRRLIEAHALKANDPLPPLPADEKQKLTGQLVEERTDAALNSWLAESRKQIEIVYEDKDLQ
jgi:hypothetical protein